MTWKELKDKIGKMPAGEQEREVHCWSEEKPLKPVILEVVDENWYYRHDWDSCYRESDLDHDQKNDPGTELYVKKGTYFLWID